jgi:hypothetical protein
MLEDKLAVGDVVNLNSDINHQIEKGQANKDPVVRIKPLRPGRPGDDPVVQPNARRDFASAIDLVTEACEAIRLAEERAVAAEQYSQELNEYIVELTKVSDSKTAALEKRLEAAEARASEAEEWLIRFHDAVMSGFGSLRK